MQTTLWSVQGFGLGGNKVSCWGCLRNWYRHEDATLCPECNERAMILAELLGVRLVFAQDLLPDYMVEVMLRRLETGIDAEEMTGMIGIEADTDIVSEGIRMRLVAEGRIPPQSTRPTLVKIT
jgi:hypothetical protein